MSTKITALPASTGLVLTDIFPLVDDPGGVPVTQKATFTQLQTLFAGAFVLKAGDSMTGALSIDNGSQVASLPFLNLSQTWNNAAVSFTGLFSNITDTASATTSSLMRFQVDGVDTFSVTRLGRMFMLRQEANNSGPVLNFQKRGSAGGGETGSVAAGAVLATLAFNGYDGTAFASGAEIAVSATEAWSGTAHGTQILLRAAAAGVTAQTTICIGFVPVTGFGQLYISHPSTLAFGAGAEARVGNAVLVAGTVTVARTIIGAASIIMLTRKTAGGVLGNLTYTITAGTSFTITSDNIADTSTVSFLLIEVA